MTKHQVGFHSENLVSVLEEHDIGDLLKPLTQEIHLFDSYIAGTTHLQNKEVLTNLQLGDDCSLQREVNKFDSNAILILNQQQQKLGYIPEKDNLIFARLMDAGKYLKAKISQIDKKGSFYQIKIGIYLVDF